MKMKTKSILYILGAFIFGIIATAFIMYKAAPGIMILEDESAYNFEEATARFKEKVKEMGWKIPAIHNLQETMRKFNKRVRRVIVFEICHAEHAYKILSRDNERVVSSLMPCRVAIYEKSNGKVYVSRLNSGLMGKMMSGVIPEVMGIAAKESEIMINSILKR